MASSATIRRGGRWRETLTRWVPLWMLRRLLIKPIIAGTSDGIRRPPMRYSAIKVRPGAVPHQHRQHRRRRGGRLVPLPLQDEVRGREPEQLPAQRPSRHVRERRVQEPQHRADLHGREGRQDARQGRAQGRGTRPPRAAGQRRAEVHAELRVPARAAGHPDADRRHQGVRRAARRPVLRRPGRDLRPGDPRAGAAEGRPGRPGRRRRRPEGLQHPHDRDPGADRQHQPDRQGADGRVRPPLGDRRLRLGRAARGHVPQRRPGVALPAGLPPRRAAHQRGRDPARAEGPLERQRAGGRRAVPEPVHQAGARRPTSTCSSRA